MKTIVISIALGLALGACESQTPQDPGRSGKQAVPGGSSALPGVPDIRREPSALPRPSRREPVTRWM